MERFTDADYKLGDTGITIPKGMVVTVPVYAMHQDPEFFPDPERFDPDRYVFLSDPHNASSARENPGDLDSLHGWKSYCSLRMINTLSGY
ncbi:hypothetical protein TNCV_4341141 [Trichonephila clavipes]|nr:hypothetical protein TNCV_4341141 [Trichonephila clavipes]